MVHLVRPYSFMTTPSVYQLACTSWMPTHVHTKIVWIQYNAPVTIDLWKEACMCIAPEEYTDNDVATAAIRLFMYVGVFAVCGLVVVFRLVVLIL